MKLISVNVGLPREILWHGVHVTTGIFKESIGSTRVVARKLDLDGDRQADLNVHGGQLKAVYGYPLEHYEFWKWELARDDWQHGMFGENFTTEGLLEKDLCIGDQISIGAAVFAVAQPRLPCYKLNVRFDDSSMVKRFLASGRSGFYFAVVREGEIGAGDEITITSRDPNRVSIADINRLFTAKELGPADGDTMERALRVPILPEFWREQFSQQLEFLRS
ncbi:MAG: MOSC domain-containing protein [Candidatus Acidiferrales bacterium]